MQRTHANVYSTCMDRYVHINKYTPSALHTYIVHVWIDTYTYTMTRPVLYVHTSCMDGYAYICKYTHGALHTYIVLVWVDTYTYTSTRTVLYTHTDSNAKNMYTEKQRHTKIWTLVSYTHTFVQPKANKNIFRSYSCHVKFPFVFASTRSCVCLGSCEHTHTNTFTNRHKAIIRPLSDTYIIQMQSSVRN